MKSHKAGPTTERLEQRAMLLDDAPAFYALNSHPDVMRYTGEPPLQSLADAEKAIADYPDFEQIGFGRWGCFYKPTGDLIGFCGLKYLPEFDAVDVGFRFLPQYWGQGLATEACRASLAFGFDVLGLDRILGFVLAENAASIRVLEKVGMHQNGTVDFEGLEALRYEIRCTDSPPN